MEVDRVPRKEREEMALLSGENGHRLRPNSTKDEKSTSADETIGDGDAKRHHSHLNHRHHSARVSNGDTRAPSVVSAAASISAQLVWSDYVATSGMLALIFGGCCSNVFALESIIQPHPSSGLVITLTQFLFVTLLNLPSHLYLATSPVPHPRLRPPIIPFADYLQPISLFFATNALNNLAFSYRISVPLHIILRSGSSVTTMLIGYCFTSRRYTRLQCVSVAMITVGVVIAALADAHAKGKLHSTATGRGFGKGLAILLVAQLLSAWMGINTQRLYARYGRERAGEFLFWSHALSLPLFLPFLPYIFTELSSLLASNLVTVPLSGGRFILPQALLALALNALTQYACISGVNVLAARSSALTVTVVLNVRKLLSLILSVAVFGGDAGLDLGVGIGAAWVFGGGAVYGYSIGRAGVRNAKKEVAADDRTRVQARPSSAVIRSTSSDRKSDD